ncbi:MAG TPA: hypothetical protein VFD98_03680 [Terracidiphilus sp.]|jgi:hypothetical protein|nr:hypothetical protein [Terracidiphilus sp.]
MIRERWDLLVTVLLAGTGSLLFASANLAAQDFHAVSQPSDASSMASSSSTTPPYSMPAEEVFEYSAADPQATPPSSGEKKSDWDKGPDAWNTIIYPIYAWAPFLGVDVTLPEIPSPPGGGGPITPEGSASGSFNGAAFAGAEVLKSKWEITGSVLWAGLSGDKTTPSVHVDAHVIFGQIMAGRELVNGLYFEGGVRRMAVHIGARVLDFPEVSRKPGVWDPLLGATYRKQLNKKWRFVGNFAGGGFGVGSDYDFSEGAHADWRFAKHFGMTMGAAALQFKISNTILDNTSVRKTLITSQTMWGPVFGFGIYF